MILALSVAACLLAPPAPVPGDSCQPFTIETRVGKPFTWKPGRTTIVAFCAFWCNTWKDQLPRIDEARRDLNGLPIDFLTISVDGRWSELGQKAAVGENLSDPGGRWTSAIGIDRVPYTLLIDPKGTILWSAYGVVRSQELVSYSRKAIAGATTQGSLYLTFDDFPSEKGSDELLDALRAVHVPATFFCVCSRANQFSAVMRRTVQEGHELEIHAWIHDEPKPDLLRCAEVLVGLGGKPALYRPPGSERILDLSGSPLSYPIIDPYDYKRPGAAELVRRVTHQARPGAVIQLHAGVQDSVEALPKIVESLRKRGYEFRLL